VNAFGLVPHLTKYYYNFAGRGALLGDGPMGGGGGGFSGDNRGGNSWDDNGPGNNSYTEPAFFNEPNSSFNSDRGI